MTAKKPKKVTIKQVDEALSTMGPQIFVPTDEVPEFLIDRSGYRVMREEIHEGAIHFGGEVRKFVETAKVVDKLLDLRNELSPPVHTIPQEAESTTEGEQDAPANDG